METIAIINLKGGVGKTTTAINMATLLALKHKKRVLLIDNDPQGNASQFFNCYDGEADTCGAAKILQREKPEIISKKGIDVISANISLLKADNTLRTSTERQDDRMKNYLASILGEYDYCIIDNPPALLMCTINALCAANEVIVPITLDNWALDGIEMLATQIEELQALNNRLKIAGVLLTNYRKTPENEVAEKWLRAHCRYRVFETQIRRSDKAIAATYYKQPLEEYSPRSAAAVTYRKFVKEYMES